MDVVDRHLVDGRGSAPPLSGLTDPRHSRIAADQSALPTGVSGGAPLEAFASVREHGAVSNASQLQGGTHQVEMYTTVKEHGVVQDASQLQGGTHLLK